MPANSQTGSGKTHTMMGSRGELGICAMAILELLHAEKEHKAVRVAVVEVGGLWQASEPRAGVKQGLLHARS